MIRRISVLFLLCLFAFAADKGPKKMPKPGFNLFSVDQDIQMGREYAQQIEQQFKVVNNKELTDYINRIGKRLVEKGGLQGYPFFFKVVHEDSINAFALPGGPMYVHTGLITAVDSEGELAGVLAHELSHVVLRHSTNQVSKQNLIQLPAMIGSMAAGGGMIGQLAQLGIGLGANSVLMKFSRGAESDSDYLGLHTMSKAGYDPLDMGRMFEKLEAAAGGGSSKIQEFFSSHPNPGNRVKVMEEQVQYLPKRQVMPPEGDLQRMKKAVQSLGPAPKRGQGGGAQSGGQQAPPVSNAPMPNIQVSQRMTEFRGGGISFQHPEGWKVQQAQSGVTIVPAQGVVEGGGIGWGILVGSGQAQGGRVDLRRDTEQILKNLVQGNPGTQLEGQPRQVQVAGSPAYVSRLVGASPFAGDKETIVVMTIDRSSALYSMIFIAPASQWAKWEPVYQRVSQSIRFE